MSLTLTLENVDQLDDGGPVSVALTTRPLQVGRGGGMDWVLPDPTRHLSSHHFDVVFREGSHWLEDVSTNGTFLQGQRYRLDGAHRLQAGDRFQVGPYIIAVSRTEVGGAAPGRSPGPAPASSWGTEDDPWAIGGPLDPVDPLPRAKVGRRDDFADEFLAPPSFAAPPEPEPETPAPPPEPSAPPEPRPLTAAPRPDPSAMRPPERSRAPETAEEPAASAVVAAFCQGAGLDASQFGDVDALALVREAGAALRGVTQESMAHLRARAAFRKETRGAVERTMAGLAGNPLKTAPLPERALEELFFRPRAGAAKGAEAMEAAARDLRLHHAAVIAALQPALGAVLHDLAPEVIEKEAAGGLLSGRRAKAWDAFVERWDGKAATHENGMLDEFFVHLSQAYAEALRRAEAPREETRE
ncbi:type VI secretion system-associated FHA domain protein TagH [Jannaschia marina]|uniref:type VI secretion system-associated FHA domain protein TagH n=1 Tax=Jannaschia marina TaxID=2741674 RepID=UPI0015CE75D1|nr:type VI secretion system-associated FHA domain protein TagH [Jannaschia marina]